MDNNAVDPVSKSVNATEQSSNQQMIDAINSVNNNVMRGYPKNNENLKQPVSNSLSNQENNNVNNSIGNGNKMPKSSTSKRNPASSFMSKAGNKFGLPGTRKGINTGGSALKNKVASNAMKAMGLGGAAAGALLDAQQRNEQYRRQGLAGRIFDALTGRKPKDQIQENTTDTAGDVQISGRMKKAILATILGPVLTFGLVVFISVFLIFTTLENMHLPADKIMNDETTMEKIDKKLDSADDSDVEEGVNNASNSDISFSLINTNLPIYSIKMSKTNVLALTNSTILEDYDFDMDKLKELYPSATDYKDVEYSEIFFAKLYDLNEYYKSECNGKQVLDFPLLMLTLQLESDDMKEVFASNIGVNETGTFVRSNIDEKFYDHEYDWSNYIYDPHNSIHDMEILAQHMVSKRKGSTYCKYDADGYKEFLQEFIEKKYYLNNDDDTRLSAGRASSNYFQKYELTEDQLIQIASLCAQEQGHSNPKGAAAEASLMANKFEVQGAEYSAKYSNSADALYHYVREVGWWAKAAYHMDKRNVKPEIVEAVRDVLVNGNRTLPKYVNSHDCPNCGPKDGHYICPNGKRGDICSVITNGNTYTDEKGVANRSNYIPNKTIVKNVYGSTATFWGFPSSAGDPFSYKDAKLRDKFGDCRYDFDKKIFVDCKDFSSVLVEWMVRIANDDSHGYSQTDRAALVDFDCSSMVYYGLLNSGFSTTQLGSYPFTTHTEQAILKKNGFTEIPVNSDCSNLEVGDILWREGHTEVYIGEGMSVGAHSASNGGISDGQRGDQNGKEISVVNVAKNSYWTYAYRYEN